MQVPRLLSDMCAEQGKRAEEASGMFCEGFQFVLSNGMRIIFRVKTGTVNKAMANSPHGLRHCARGVDGAAQGSKMLQEEEKADHIGRPDTGSDICSGSWH